MFLLLYKSPSFQLIPFLHVHGHCQSCLLSPRQKKSLWFLVIGLLQYRCNDESFILLFCVIRVNMYTYLLEPDQISHTQSMVAKRGRTNWANIHTPTDVKKSYKTQHGRIQIDPAILPAIGHRFITTTKNETILLLSYFLMSRLLNLKYLITANVLVGLNRFWEQFHQCVLTVGRPFVKYASCKWDYS